jgi:hypothetical protein
MPVPDHVHLGWALVRSQWLGKRALRCLELGPVSQLLSIPDKVEDVIHILVPMKALESKES